MRYLLLFAITLATISGFSQVSYPADSVKAIKVFYKSENDHANSQGYFVDGTYLPASAASTSLTDANGMDKINVVKKDYEIDGVKYSSQIQIKMKQPLDLKLISLTDLKLKYTRLKNEPVMFAIDQDIISADYNKYVVNENYVLSIIVRQIDNKKDPVVYLVMLVTKSEENIKRSRQVFIRGMEEASME